MTAQAPKDIRIFFSWQSDSPIETNRNAIRAALQGTRKTLVKSHPGVNLVLEEATARMPGSGNIMTSITEKIEQSDIFIADVTTVFRSGKRTAANPNVLIELGYASAHLGWGRIVLLFNHAHGDFPGDLPFDIVQNRASPYKVSAAPDGKGLTGTASLDALVRDAVVAVLDASPPFPHEARSKSPEQIHHDRDVSRLRGLLELVNFPVLDEHTHTLPHHFADEVLWYWEGFTAAVHGPSFGFYDSELQRDIMTVHDAWHDTVRFDGRYHPNLDSSLYIFSGHDNLFDASKEDDWNTIQRGAHTLHAGIRSLLARVRRDYLEVDVDETDKAAYRSNRAFHARMAERQASFEAGDD